jgi:hypothetical protein
MGTVPTARAPGRVTGGFPPVVVTHYTVAMWIGGTIRETVALAETCASPLRMYAVAMHVVRLTLRLATTTAREPDIAATAAVNEFPISQNGLREKTK